jgi:aldose sugar dehydrogenase
MNNYFLYFAIFLIYSCGQGANSAHTNHTDAETAEERDYPADGYQPAFRGQTNADKVKTATAWSGEVISKDLRRPWGIAALPDGRLLITEKQGTMRISNVKGELSERITGIPEVVDDGQGGLLGLAIDPEFEKNRMIYWVFAEKYEEGNVTAVASGKLSSDEKKIENPKVIYRALPTYNGTLHYGGRIVFDKSGNLFISTGERSDIVTRPQAQDLSSGLGKIIYITKEGRPVAVKTNSAKGALPEVYSWGHRNVQGLAFHPETGDLWESEMGPKGGDELNLVAPGKNYGWPVITYGMEYSGNKVGEGLTAKDGMEQPVYYWDPVLSPSGMTFYNGSEIPEWKNSLFISGLSSMTISRLVIENNKVTGEERLLESEGQRFRDVTQGNDGALYAITDSGRLYRIAKKK